MTKRDDERDARPLSTFSEAAVGLGSGVIALGFWGFVIDQALKYSPYQTKLNLMPDDIFWFFVAVFVAGLVVVAFGAVSGRRAKMVPGS